MPEDFSLECPFWIDTDGYTDRDREMFVAGYEFSLIVRKLCEDDAPFTQPIHRENESRIRMACAKFERKCDIEACDDRDGTWSFLKVGPK